MKSDLSDIPKSDLMNVKSRVFGKTNMATAAAMLLVSAPMVSLAEESVTTSPVSVPKVDLGPFALHPTIFVNFFGLGLLVMVFPAALYSDAQARKIKAIED